jgi:superfamily II DNA/RNA helicase
MRSCCIVSLLLVASTKTAPRVAAFTPSSLLTRNGPKYANLFSTAEDVESVISIETKSKPSSSEKLPDFFPALATPLGKLGFSTPTPIQSVSAKRALRSENLLMIAPTGSGKTLSYMLPALEKVVTQRKQQEETVGVLQESAGPSTILVVAPTRELALQLMRDTTSILSNLDEFSHDDNELAVLLAVQGVGIPTTQELDAATVLIGTPKELLYVLSEVKGGSEFLAGDVLSTVILDEVDVLLPNPPKQLRTALDNAGNGRNERKGGKKANTPQDERRRQEQKRKLMAAKRQGVEFSSDKQIVGPTETLLKMISGRRLYTANGNGSSTTPYHVIAGSATASRKTLDRLNKALRDSAMDASSTVDIVWNGDVKACRPDGETSGNESDEQQDHTIRAVTVPSQVKHQYIRLEKDQATKPGIVLQAVAKATEVLKPKRALLFLCGEFRKQTTAAPAKKQEAPQGKRQQPRKGRQKTLKQKKMEAAAAARAKAPSSGLSARKACSGLSQLGIEAKPLHVALGLEANAKDEDLDEEDDNIPPFLVTFEGSARGLHLDDVDVVFIVGRPSSAASYLHLAGRVGRSSASASGEVVVKPGNVVSFCTAGSSKELNKWTKQVGGTDLEELVL